MQHPLDAALQTACPTVMVPKYAPFEPLDKPGHRLLSASDGLWIEIRRPWLHMIWPVALQNTYPLPYGSLEKTVTLAFGKIPVDLVRQFHQDALRAFPNECGAWLIWDDHAKELRYQPMEAIRSKVGYLKAKRPDLKDHESLAINLHSHGPLPADFSSRDDRDDRNEVKIAGVVGSLHKAQPTVAFRICTGGDFVTFSAEKLLPALEI